MKRTYPAVASALLSCLILGLLVPAALAGSTPAPARAGSEPLDTLPQAGTGWSVVRIYYSDRNQLNAIAGRLDIWENHPDKGYAVAALTPEEMSSLQNLGYRLEVDVGKTAQAAPQAVLDPRFYYYDNFVNNTNGRYVVNFLQDMNLAHPSLTELIDLGDAWQASHSGYHRDIWALRITNEDPAFGVIANKPVFILFAGIHAREVATPELAIRYIRYLLEGYSGMGGYGLDPDATWLVDNNVVYVIVMQNPDGHVPNEQDKGANRRKNMDSDDGCAIPLDWGVDLNRNHSFFWGVDNNGSSPVPCYPTYRGPAAASEPETQAFQAFFPSVIPDQNGPNGDFTMPPAAPDDTTGIFLSLHSYSDLVLWPWSLNPPPANEAQLSAIGRKIAYYTGLTPSGGIGYDVNGATDDWTYGKFGIASFTIEIGPDFGTCSGFFPSFDCIDGNGSRSFWQEMRPAFLYMHKIARTPYLTVYGPDTQDVHTNPGVVSPGDPITLSATISDHRYGSDPLAQVAAAEYFIDIPGADGAGIPLTPADGTWGGLSEAVTASIDTSALPLGRHTLLVHGKSTGNRWGPLIGVFLVIQSPPIAGFSFPTPVVAGQPLRFTNLTVGTEPITYTWDFGDNSSTSDIRDPVYTYTLTGAYTVTLSAFNALGSDAISQTLQVEPCVEIGAITLTQVTPGPIVSVDMVEFSLDLSPQDAYKPYSYSLDFGDGTAPLAGEQQDDPLVRNHAYTAPGNYPLTAQVSNCAMTTPLTTTISVSVLERHGMTLLPAVSSLTGDPGSVVTHTLQLTNIGDTPDTFTLTLGASAWASTLTTATLTIPPGGTAPLGVRVAVPQDAAGGDADSVAISVYSSYTSTPPASATVNTSATHIYQLALDVPVTQRLGHPGEVVTYTVEIHNTGTATDTYDISTSGAAWAFGASANPVTIPPGGSLPVEIWVAIPASANGGLDIVQITVRSRGDTAQTASTTLTTTADWRIYLAQLAR